jgi:hypothetical protein
MRGLRGCGIGGFCGRGHCGLCKWGVCGLSLWDFIPLDFNLFQVNVRKFLFVKYSFVVLTSLASFKSLSCVKNRICFKNA